MLRNHPIQRVSMLGLGCLILSSCGFVTTPLAFATAEAASTTVKAADYGLYQSKQAAIFLRDQGTAGAQVTVEFLGSIAEDLDNTLRSNTNSPGTGDTAPGI